MKCIKDITIINLQHNINNYELEVFLMYHYTKTVILILQFGPYIIYTDM